MKWFTSAILVLLGGSLIFSAASQATGVRWLDEVGFVLSMAGLASLPATVGIAILRYRLYGIDLIINCALVYGPLTAMLVLCYLGGVISLQAAFRSLTGQESTLAVVGSTLAIAALFNPLRRRVQGFVDSRLYRRKYDAVKTLATFNPRLRKEIELDALSNTLVGVVRGTMQPEHVCLWLRPRAVHKGTRQTRPLMHRST